jgi:hypothetical protein
MMEKIGSISNFIGVYDNYILDFECKKAIDLFEHEDKLKRTLNRLSSEKSSVLQKEDQQYFVDGGNINIWWESLKPLMLNFDIALKHYLKNTGFLEAYGIDNVFYTHLKIQKTLPTEGYHVWHVEHNGDYNNSKRGLAFGIYLNDVEEGGETEFLHFSKRVKPKKGRIVVWPAGFPYVHRGNPPLSGEKYLLTSWLNLV